MSNRAASDLAPCTDCPYSPRGRALFSTGVAAREMGVHPITLLKWRKRGFVTPAEVTLAGHFRWDIRELRAALVAYTYGPPAELATKVDSSEWPFLPDEPLPDPDTPVPDWLMERAHTAGTHHL